MAEIRENDEGKQEIHPFGPTKGTKIKQAHNLFQRYLAGRSISTIALVTISNESNTLMLPTTSFHLIRPL